MESIQEAGTVTASPPERKVEAILKNWRISYFNQAQRRECSYSCQAVDPGEAEQAFYDKTPPWYKFLEVEEDRI